MNEEDEIRISNVENILRDINEVHESILKRNEHFRKSYYTIPLNYDESINEQIKLNWTPNMVDKFKFYVPPKYLPKDKKFTRGRCPFLKWGYDTFKSRYGNEYYKPYIEGTGKITSKPWFLGGIYEGNVQEVVDYIEEKIGIKIDASDFVQLTMTEFDIKQDMMFPEEDYLSPYIDKIEELIKRHVPNVYTESHEYKGIKCSVLAQRTAKDIQDSLSYYIKLLEMLYHKSKNDYGYYDSFDEEFLSICESIIRCERRLRGKDIIQKALKLDKDEEVTLQKVFDCKFNILEDITEKYMGIDWSESITESNKILPKTATKFLSDLGIETLLSICGHSLNGAVSYLKNLYPNDDRSNAIKKIKEYIKRQEKKQPYLRMKLVDILGYNLRIYEN